MLARVHLGLVTIVVPEYGIRSPVGWASCCTSMTSARRTAACPTAASCSPRPPRTEPYGRVAVFLDVAGNKWDLIGPA
jgi:hypothetical protein